MRLAFGALFASIIGVLGTLAIAPAAEAAFAGTSMLEVQETSQRTKGQSARETLRGVRTRRADAFVCDLYTHVCVKFTRTETKAIASYLGPGLIGAVSWASYLCGKIPAGAGVVGCTAVVSIYAYLLDRSFNSAAANGKCVELHFPYTLVGGGFWWKTEGC